MPAQTPYWESVSVPGIYFGVDGADGLRNEGIVPLADFVDREAGDACAVAVEYDADGTVIPVVYLRRGGRLVEHSLPRHPLHTFGTDEHRQQLAWCLAPLLSRKTSASSV
jgi:hypothetical protein